MLVLWLLPSSRITATGSRRSSTTRRSASGSRSIRSIYSVLRSLVRGGYVSPSRSSGTAAARADALCDHARGAASGGTARAGVAGVAARRGCDAPSRWRRARISKTSGVCRSCCQSATRRPPRAARAARGPGAVVRPQPRWSTGSVRSRRPSSSGQNTCWRRKEDRPMAEQQPEIQLIANLVVRRPDGRVLLVRYRGRRALVASRR